MTVGRGAPNRFLFIDRDGVINVERGDFTTTVAEWEWAPGALEGICRLTEAGYGIIVATNQSCITRGIMTEEALTVLHNYMLGFIRKHGGDILKIYYCPHVDADNCLCRKPKPGMLFMAAEEFGIDLSTTFFIGDMPRDKEAARRSGIRFILVENKFNRDMTELEDVEYRTASLLEAADIVLGTDRL